MIANIYVLSNGNNEPLGHQELPKAERLDHKFNCLLTSGNAPCKQLPGMQLRTNKQETRAGWKRHPPTETEATAELVCVILCELGD